MVQTNLDLDQELLYEEQQERRNRPLKKTLLRELGIMNIGGDGTGWHGLMPPVTLVTSGLFVSIDIE